MARDQWFLPDVIGPVQVPFVTNGSGAMVDVDALDRGFWDNVGWDLADAFGCFIISIIDRHEADPWYIGGAWRLYRNEVFASHKLTKFDEAMFKAQRGVPAVTFVVVPPASWAAEAILGIERALIPLGRLVNPRLLNRHHANSDPIARGRVLEQRSPSGRPRISMAELISRLGW
jgi:hypothetical protein